MNRVVSICFTGSVGFLSEPTIVYKSSDYGESWVLNAQLDNYYSFRDIFFLNPSTGWVVGRQSLYRTTNSGMNWVNVIAGPSQGDFNVSSIYFSDFNTGYMVSGGWILKTTTGGTTVTGIEEYNSPNNFSLSQNYPNPFNPLTKIKFDVSKASFTKIIIYDLLGREVATLVNEELRPGTYEADWDASSFSSGVYFYMIISGEFVETKKMVLMK